jgi:CDP-diacylglycerol--glycerol-3-phosphate 3-phosphatidyltransferase/cardiolipin synthase
MVSAALLVLLYLDRVGIFVALVIIGREIAISALREWMAQIGAGASVAVHWLGKFKTAAQMIAIPCLLQHEDWLGLPIRFIGQILIVVAALLTVWSMLYYLRKAWPEIQART